MSEVPHEGLPKGLRRLFSAAFCFADEFVFFLDTRQLPKEDEPRWKKTYYEYCSEEWMSNADIDHGDEVVVYKRPLQSLLTDDLHELDKNGCWNALAITHPTVKQEDAIKLIQILPTYDHKGCVNVPHIPSMLVGAISSIWQNQLNIRLNSIDSEVETDKWRDYYQDKSFELRFFPELRWPRDSVVSPLAGIHIPHFRVGKRGYTENHLRTASSCYQAMGGDHGDYLWGARALTEFIPATMVQRILLSHEADGFCYNVEATAFIGPDADYRARRYMFIQEQMVLEATKVRLGDAFQYTTMVTPWTYHKARVSGGWSGTTIPVRDDFIREIQQLGGIPLYSDLVMNNEEVSTPNDSPAGAAQRLLIDQHHEDAISFLTDGCWN